MANKSTEICLIGLSKNAGKTTALNFLLQKEFNQGLDVGITSIGRDGESIDEVYGFNKPKVFVAKNTLIASAKMALNACTCSRKILSSTGVFCAFGEIYIFRAMSDGYVELCGASTRDGLNKTTKLLKQFGAKKVFIDGAFGRKTLTNENVVLVIGASYSKDIEKTTQQGAFLASQFFLHNTKIKGESIVLDDPLTDSLADQIIAKGKKCTLIVSSINNILLSCSKMQLLLSVGITVKTLKKTNLLGIAYNPFSPYGYCYPPNFLNKLIDKLSLYKIPKNIPIFNALEEKP